MSRPVPGSEGWHPKPAPLRLRVHLAAYGMVLCGIFGFLVLRAGHVWPAVALFALAVFALGDLIWLRRKGNHRRKTEDRADGSGPW